MGPDSLSFKDSVDLTLLNWVSGICSLAGAVWGGLFFILGLERAGFIPFLFTLVTGSLWLVNRYRSVTAALYVSQLALILALPAALHFYLGGYEPSGGVILWCLLAPAGAITFRSRSRDYILWAVLCALTFTAAVAVHQFPKLLPAAEDASHTARGIFLLMNTIVAGAVILAVIVYFKSRMVNEEQRLSSNRHRLHAYINSFLDSLENLGQGRLYNFVPPINDDEVLDRLQAGYNNAVNLLRTSFKSMQVEAAAVQNKVEHNRRVLEPISSLLSGFEEAMQAFDKLSVESSQMSEKVRSNEAELHEHIVAALETASRGSEMITRSLETNQSVMDTFESGREVLNSFEDSFARVDEIMISINHINDRTQMLALNASIEAARAGEQGRGFAVVADEIHKLTDMTSTSTADIAQVTARIRQSVAGTLEIFARGVDLSAQSRSLGKESLEMISRIRENSSATSDESDENHRLTERFFIDYSGLQKHMQQTSKSIVDFLKSVQQLDRSNSELIESTAAIIEDINSYRLHEGQGRPLP